MCTYQKLSVLYYDVSKPVGKSLSGDLEFYQKHIANSNRVLEAGVGTGRLMIPYLEAGINIEGIDLSEDMVTVCNQGCIKKGLEAKAFVGNVKSYQFNKKYDAIVVPTGTFCLFDDIDAVLRNFFMHLEDGGFLMFDLIYPSHINVGQSFVYPLEISQKSRLILTDSHLDLNWITQSSTELLRYDLWDDGVLLESELQNFVLRWYGVAEIKRLLEVLGFRDIEFFGDYHNFELDKAYETVSVKAYR